MNTEQKKSLATAAVFFIFIFGFALFHLLLPDKELSSAERRKLSQVPELSVDAVFSGSYGTKFESYLLDQFPLREQLRTAKSVFKLSVLRQSDNNGIYLYRGGAVKMEYPLDEKQVLYGADKLNRLNDSLLQNANVFYSIVPDKNYFTADDTDHLSIDCKRLVELMTNRVSGMSYIDIFPCLSAEDYYRTDPHWKQECIYPVAQALAEAMDSEELLTPFEDYTIHSLAPFYGVYQGQSALPLQSDTLCFLTSPLTECAAMTGIEFSGVRPIYNSELFSGMDGYDVFLSGAQAIIEIDCPDAKSERQLIIFRDSFSSSLAPYFIGAYSKITLVDLRYISSSLLQEHIDFDGKDVLFLYSAPLLNSAMLLK